MKIDSSAESLLWAKLSPKENRWLPLKVHMRDSFAVSMYIWKNWVPDSLKNLLSKELRSDCGIDPVHLIGFLSASHDLGKASPSFQRKAKAKIDCIIERIEQSGLEIKDHLDDSKTPHNLISMLILENTGLDRTVSIVAGGHHGSPPSRSMLASRNLDAHPNNTGFCNRSWVEVQNRLTDYAVEIAGVSLESLKGVRLSVAAQDLLTGLVIMTDWLASNEEFFPLIDVNEIDTIDAMERESDGCNRIRFQHHAGLVHDPNVPFECIYGFSPREFQSMAIQLASEMTGSGIIVVEAPTGEGKTEAALAMADAMAFKSGRSGLFFGLPTQATANGIFSRVRSWMEKCPSNGTRTLILAHGKSAFNQEYTAIPRVGWDVGDGRDNVVVNEWFHGKTGILSDIVVGTVDQILMAGLKRRHLYLRHLGLAGKVVVIDECHAYDEYMGSYLCKALSWLGALDVPVIVMSATLPPKRKADMIAAYTGNEGLCKGVEDSRGYPMVTRVDGTGIAVRTADASGRRRRVSISRITDDAILGELGMRTASGGYAGIIVNTVRRAQNLFRELRAIYQDDVVVLLHSAFTSADRARHEGDLMRIMNESERPSSKRVIVVGTQVLEQSLDIDFDILFTDLCPIDLLIQRIGRLHRHDNPRPPLMKEPMCLVIDTGTSDFEGGTEAVYGRLQLMNTRILLKDAINVPDDVPDLVRRAYSIEGLAIDDDQKEDYSSAKIERDRIMSRRERKACVYQISRPDKISDLVGWLDNSADDPQGLCAEATVRDTSGTVEVVLVKRGADGSFRIFGDVDDSSIPKDCVPDKDTARRMSENRVALPHWMISRFGIEDVVRSVRASNRDIPKAWAESEWLSGELLQIVDENNRFEAYGCSMEYDHVMGLMSYE